MSYDKNSVVHRRYCHYAFCADSALAIQDRHRSIPLVPGPGWSPAPHDQQHHGQEVFKAVRADLCPYFLDWFDPPVCAPHRFPIHTGPGESL